MVGPKMQEGCWLLPKAEKKKVSKEKKKKKKKQKQDLSDNIVSSPWKIRKLDSCNSS